MNEQTIRYFIRALLSEQNKEKKQPLRGTDRLKAIARTSKSKVPTIQRLINTINSNNDTVSIFGQVPIGANASEAAVAKLLADLAAEGEHVIIAASKMVGGDVRAGPMPAGWYRGEGTIKQFLIYSSSRLNAEQHDKVNQRIADALEGHKPDSGLLTRDGNFVEIEVKSTKEKNWGGADKKVTAGLPPASRTDYDVWVLISTEVTLAFSHDAYSGGALARFRSPLPDGSSSSAFATNIKTKELKDEIIDQGITSRPDQIKYVRDTLDEFVPDIEQMMTNFIYKSILNRLMGKIPRGDRIAMPVTFDGQRARIDIKYDHYDRRMSNQIMLSEELTKSDKKEIEKISRKQAQKEITKVAGKDLDKTIKKAVEKVMKDKATKEEMAKISKAVLKKLYRDLAISYPQVIDRIKV